ncbi:MAG: YicC family protein [Fusobacterium perfoetens]|uniref:YicC/YloC family endoribonuclease n=1 Tax=Fusobacterium perfoetens TaxID=852 RepID=UPI0023F3924C|nr:YicC/YloC family endoribonuclease [Fusobacterium perfoetens]MCI6152978.1 YicC family protein [Fusobacterium perfoetens]MDY3237375.1 YicC/YloC family endoribonuclease [Fusobacterium perfoetens]
MRSMTGYSKYSYQDENFIIDMEIKSVNNKNLNLKIKMPTSLNFLESKIRTKIGEKVTRGSIDLKIDFEDRREIENLFEYDEQICKAYLKVLTDMENNFGEKFTNKMDYLIRNFNVIKRKENDNNDYEEIIFSKLDNLLEEFLEFKDTEGNRLKEYFIERLEFIKERVTEIKKYKNQVVAVYKEKLLKRLENIKEEVSFNEEDILKEILLFTDRSDISEEISRLDSHLKQLEIEIKSEDKIVGKKIDFILQEIFRELNTTGVKSSSYEISKIVVECKNEIEKIREQAMNIE